MEPMKDDLRNRVTDMVRLGLIDTMEEGKELIERLEGLDPYVAQQALAIMSKKNPELHVLVKTREEVQKLRIAIGNREGAMVRLGLATLEEAVALHNRVGENLKGLEEDLAELYGPIVESHPVWETWLKDVKGIGVTTAGQILGLMDDVGRFDTVSKLWAYTGLGVFDGKIQRRTKGEKANWNNRFKTVLLGIVFTGFMRARGSYSGLYYEFRAAYDEKHPDESDGHRHNMARRKVMKLFLSHLWQVWREAEGLPVREPYSIGQLGHTTKIDPLTG